MADHPGGKVRISKLLSERGLCSRRKADDFISKGWVTVNGEKAELGQKVDESDVVELAPEAQNSLLKQMTIILNKPIGYVSNLPEKNYKEARELLLPENQFLGDKDKRLDPRPLDGLAVAGRLDIESQGLLVFTQDGQKAKQLIGENSQIEKEYLVRVEGHINEEQLRLLNHGLSLDQKKLKAATVEWINADQLRFVLKEGKKRQIRRMCEQVGLAVTGLKRVRIGKVMLADLPNGQWRLLRDDESF